jgi:hypothetical protein
MRRSPITDAFFKGLGILGFGMAVYNTTNSIRVRAVMDKLERERDKNERLQEILNEISKIKAERLGQSGDFNTMNLDLKSRLSELQRTIEDLNTFKNDTLTRLINNSPLTLEEKINSLILKTEKLNSEMKNVNEAYEKLVEIATKCCSDNFLNFNPIERIQDFLSVLNFEQTLAFVHLSGSFVIALCLLSLFTVFYSDKLIIYFKLEEKFPRIGKYIQLRRKFQHYYFLINVFIIIFILIGIVYVNTLILFY